MTTPILYLKSHSQNGRNGRNASSTYTGWLSQRVEKMLRCAKAPQSGILVAPIIIVSPLMALIHALVTVRGEAGLGTIVPLVFLARDVAP